MQMTVLAVKCCAATDASCSKPLREAAEHRTLAVWREAEGVSVTLRRFRAHFGTRRSASEQQRTNWRGGLMLEQQRSRAAVSPESVELARRKQMNEDSCRGTGDLTASVCTRLQ